MKVRSGSPVALQRSYVVVVGVTCNQSIQSLRLLVSGFTYQWTRCNYVTEQKKLQGYNWQYIFKCPSPEVNKVFLILILFSNFQNSEWQCQNVPFVQPKVQRLLFVLTWMTKKSGKFFKKLEHQIYIFAWATILDSLHQHSHVRRTGGFPQSPCSTDTVRTQCYKSLLRWDLWAADNH